MMRCLGFRAVAIGLVMCAVSLGSGCPAGDDGTTNASTDDSTSSDSTASTSTASTTAMTTVSTTEATSSTTTANPTTSTTAVDTSTSTETGTLPGEPCGDFECEPTQYCDWPTNDCGVDGFDPPACVATPDGCPGVEGDPVCGCDGVVYSDECTATIAGVDVDEASGCTPPGDLFPCGFKYCDPTVAYCRVSTSDIGGFPNGYACVPLPDACEMPATCDCLANEPCFEFSCDVDAGGPTIVCPGG